MIFRYKYGDGVWIDLEHPTEEEIHHIAQEFSISERFEAELLMPTSAPLVATEADTTLVIVNFPTHGVSDGEIRDQEIDLLVGNSFIITLHYEVIEPLRHLQKLLETQHLISPHERIAADVLLETIFAHLYTSVRDHISHVASRLTHIEHDMFNGLERTTVRSISNVNREFLHIEASLVNQEDSLARFLKTLMARPAFATSLSERGERILAERAQVARIVATYRAVATELRETNASLLEARQNEIMKTLTVITFGVLPLELIALIFGMHELGTPFEQDPNAFWIILSLMVGVGSIMMAFFTRKHWFS